MYTPASFNLRFISWIIFSAKKIKIIAIFSYFFHNIRFKIPITLIEQMDENEISQYLTSIYSFTLSSRLI